MLSCATPCGTICIPTKDPNFCGTAVRAPGGISYIVFAPCDSVRGWTREDMEDLATWEPLGIQGQLRISDQLAGEAPEMDFVSLRTSTCGAEQDTGSTITVNLSDFNAPLDGSKHIWWNYVKRTPGLAVGYIGCSGQFYGWFTGYNLRVSPVTPLEVENSQRFVGSLMIQQNTIDMPVPLLVPGLVEALKLYDTIQCDTVPIIDPYEPI